MMWLLSKTEAMPAY
uniref:Uncharacterized protein n=1 Tax=Rhizophora mucronata TaxID=61149 RepID=A0A2P2L0T7_RHIMU